METWIGRKGGNYIAEQGFPNRMSWQDIVIAIANFMFTFSLFSQMYHGFKKKKGFIILRTAGLTSIGLYTISVAFFTLSLYFSAAISFVNATLWASLFVQRLIYEKA